MNSLDVQPKILVRIDNNGAPIRDEILMREYMGKLGIIVCKTEYSREYEDDPAWWIWNVFVNGEVEEFFADELMLISQNDQ